MDGVEFQSALVYIQDILEEIYFNPVPVNVYFLFFFCVLVEESTSIWGQRIFKDFWLILVGCSFNQNIPKLRK